MCYHGRKHLRIRIGEIPHEALSRPRARLLLALCLASAAADEPVEYISGSYTYVLLEDGTAEFTRYTGISSDLTVPEALDGYRVTGNGTRAFSSCDTLLSITVPDSVTRLGVNPFLGCGRLTDIRVSPSHPTLTTIDGVLFDKTENKLVCYPCALTATDYTVPHGIRIIGDYAFYHCAALTNITLPDTLTSIGKRAFCLCDSLTGVLIPDGVAAIDDSAFAYCRSLKSITLPDSLVIFGINAFQVINKNATFTVPQGSYAEQWCRYNEYHYTYPNANDWLPN